MRCSTTTDFKADLEAGSEYEEFVYGYFRWKWNIEIHHFAGKEEQTRGENNKGLEIKFDRKWHSTGNLYIETADRVDGTGGIYRQNNTRWLLIGDRSKFWVFRIEDLRRYHTELDQDALRWFAEADVRPSQPPYRFHRVCNPKSNSKAFLLPISTVEQERLCVFSHALDGEFTVWWTTPEIW